MRFRAPDPFVLAAVLAAALLGAATPPPALARDLLLEQRTDAGLVPARPMLAEDVFDPVFAFLLAVLDHDQIGIVDQAFLDSLATAEGGSKVPYRTISTMERRPESGGPDAMVRIELHEELAAPIPYSILGYNPGTIRAAQRIDMLHWATGDGSFEVEGEDEDDPPTVLELEDGHLFVIADGFLEMDIDGWLDRLLGGRLDDVHIVGFYVFRHEGTRIGLGFGYNNKQKGRTGVFDFGLNESVFPGSREYLGVGRQTRELAERRLAAWREARAAADGAPPAGAVPRDERR